MNCMMPPPTSDPRHCRTAQPIVAAPVTARKNRPQSPFCSSRIAQTPMYALPGASFSAIIQSTYPSHRSFLREVTCIKDGFFFCAVQNCLQLDISTEACP